MSRLYTYVIFPTSPEPMDIIYIKARSMADACKYVKNSSVMWYASIITLKTYKKYYDTLDKLENKIRCRTEFSNKLLRAVFNDPLP